jgi:DNA repair photolyase
MISGVTDCYQPAEREYKLTRGILEVMLEAHQPVCLITKNVLVLRDADLLAALAARKLVGVALSITTLDAELARTLEPRTATPAAKLRAIRELTAAGVPVRAMVAPIIPGLTDNEIPAILQAVKEAGALAAGYTMLRLPLAVAPIFTAWLQQHRPQSAARIESLIREMRGGKLNDSRFGNRMRGSGAYADGIARSFELFRDKLGLNAPWEALDCTQFRPRLRIKLNTAFQIALRQRNRLISADVLLATLAFAFNISRVFVRLSAHRLTRFYFYVGESVD